MANIINFTPERLNLSNTYCNLCPNACNVDRQNVVGFCGSSDKISIAKYYLHDFEEPLVSGKNGSGTVFFCGCSLKCVFCQNYEVSRNLRGKQITTLELVEIFKFLEDNGAHNINLVNPTHYSNQIVDALNIYRPSVPIVYNTHGFESVDVLKQIDDYIDVYLPDLKFCAPNVSKRYCGKSNYFNVAKDAISFMSTKPLKIDENGLISSGTIVRHLCLPQNVSDSKKVLDFLVNFKDKIYLSVMSQYTPFGKIDSFPELQRKLTKREYDTVIDYAINLGFTNMYYQELESSNEKFIPKWDF